MEISTLLLLLLTINKEIVSQLVSCSLLYQKLPYLHFKISILKPSLETEEEIILVLSEQEVAAGGD